MFQDYYSLVQSIETIEKSVKRQRRFGVSLVDFEQVSFSWVYIIQPIIHQCFSFFQYFPVLCSNSNANLEPYQIPMIEISYENSQSFKL